MNIGGSKTKCLVTDLDGTLIHKFLTSDENQQIYTKLLELSGKAEIIIFAETTTHSRLLIPAACTKH